MYLFGLGIYDKCDLSNKRLSYTVHFPLPDKLPVNVDLFCLFDRKTVAGSKKAGPVDRCTTRSFVDSSPTSVRKRFVITHRPGDGYKECIGFFRGCAELFPSAMFIDTTSRGDACSYRGFVAILRGRFVLVYCRFRRGLLVCSKVYSHQDCVMWCLYTVYCM